MYTPEPGALRAELVRVAQGYVGENREDDPEQIGRFLGLFGLPYSPSTPYCASGASWAACKAYADLAGITYDAQSAPVVFRFRVLAFVRAYMFAPSASVAEMVEGARNRGWADAAGPDVGLRPGDLVCYDWGGGEHHVEISTSEGHPAEFDTIGFNTSCAGHSGVVADKSRGWECVWFIIRTGGRN